MDVRGERIARTPLFTQEGQESAFFLDLPYFYGLVDLWLPSDNYETPENLAAPYQRVTFQLCYDP